MTKIWAILLMVGCAVMGEGRSAGWEQSYDAGYFDENGAYAGGSEIMHLVAHEGKLYAANGYWVDARWEIPPDAEKQSAQVLRLDSAGGRWEVDLDMGRSNEFGLRYMKGNILKSVTFTRDGKGALLEKPQNLLVMAAGATMERGGAVSAWVRDEEKGTWEHSLVRHGANAGGIRWVPRDMEVYRDKVTGIERIFLSLGNPGIVSGVFDASLPHKVRWERHLEFPFPVEGALVTRPLGMVQANGSLLFSAGGSLYRRIDGERARYEEILKLGEEADADVGGIRGLTVIPNPDGDGDSLLLLWAPGERAKSEVKRLDPVGDTGYVIHDETNMRDLMKRALGVDVSYTLGAHNMMYPVIHPATGETVHLIGFQGNIRGADGLRWKPSHLYGGAMYAVRTAEGEYSVHEVNNVYAPGKPALVSPRAFSLSPFGDGDLYIGGHDSSNHISDDRAWVFKAPLGVVLGTELGDDAVIAAQKSPRIPGVDEGPVYELRVYVANEGRFQHLLKRFREHTDRLFRKHGLEPIGYWLPTEGTERQRRTFVYVLKHPSRYEGWANWKRFTHDREWRRVLDQPEFQRLLIEKPVSVFMTPTEFSAASRDAIGEEGGVFELRTYVAAPGKLSDLHDRFRDHTVRLFKKHGMGNVGYWTPKDKPESANTLICLLHHKNRKQADASWEAFRADPEWRKAAGESQEDGNLLSKPPERIFLKATDYSPLR